MSNCFRRFFFIFRYSLKEEADKLRQPPQKNAPSQTTDPNLHQKRRKMKTISTGQDDSVQFKIIKFGTNVDLSDENKFSLQMKVCLRFIVLTTNLCYRNWTKCRPFVELFLQRICSPISDTRFSEWILFNCIWRSLDAELRATWRTILLPVSMWTLAQVT